MAKNAMSNGITSGRQLMKLQRVEIEYGGKKILLFQTEYKGKRLTGSFRECALFGMGYGTDQAAELRYEMARWNKKKTADVSKAEGAKHHVV